MVELKPCPFGAGHKVWIAVHDDEGNYHGPIGCEYESDPWSGLKYALHHEDVDNCLLGTDGDYEAMGGVLFETYEEAEEAWNDRWERTCHPLSSIEYCGPEVSEVEVWACSECENVISWDYDDYDPDTDGPSYCENCGAKVVGPKVVEE